MYILSDRIVKNIATRELAYNAVREAFVAAYKNHGQLFPVVIAEGCDSGNSFSIKSGNLKQARLSGLKVGSYWANNHRQGLPNHSTTILLLDEDTGITRALINAGYLNGLRTAAANAVASRELARPDARVLSVIGAGHQALFEIQALKPLFPLEKIYLHSRTTARARNAQAQLAAQGISVEITDCETACRHADILVTVTNAQAPLFDSDWIKPGTHISAMGADQAGKQELPLALVDRAQCFADLPAQSRHIGEFEIASQQNPDLVIEAIGAVLAGEAKGRTCAQSITLFDSSGIALQDLCVAKAVLDKAIENDGLDDITF